MKVDLYSTVFNRPLDPYQSFEGLPVRQLPAPLEGCMRLRYKGTYIDVKVHPGTLLYIHTEIFNCISLQTRFCKGKTNHEIELCLFPAKLLSLHHNFDGSFESGFLIYPPLPGWPWCLHRKGKTALSDPGHLFKQIQGE